MKAKTFLKLTAAAAAMTGAACAAAGNYFVENFLSQKGIERLTHKTMLSEEEHSLLTESPAKEEGLEFFRSVVYKDVFTFNSHSECLHAIYYEAEKPSNIFVITCHGYTGSPEADSVFTGHYYRMGFNVLAPYLRAHGKSEHKYCSMGSATVIMTTGEALPSNVVCAVADCGYTSVWDEYSVQIGDTLGLPETPFLQLANLAAKIKIGFDFKEASALKQVRKSKTPTLFIHGDRDDFVPLWMNYPLYKNAACEKERLIVPNAPHAASAIVAPELYWSTVERFIKKYI